MNRLTSIISLFALVLVYGSGLALYILIALSVSTMFIYFSGGIISDYLFFLSNILSIGLIIKIIWGTVLYLKMNITGELFFYGDFTWKYKEFNYGNLNKKKRCILMIIISFLHSVIISIYVISLFYQITGNLSLYIYIVLVVVNTSLCLSVFWLDQNAYEDRFAIILNCTESLIDAYYFICS